MVRWKLRIVLRILQSISFVIGNMLQSLELFNTLDVDLLLLLAPP